MLCFLVFVRAWLHQASHHGVTLVHIYLLLKGHVLEPVFSLLLHAFHELFSVSDQSLFKDPATENSRKLCEGDQILIGERTDLRFNRCLCFVAVKGHPFFNEERKNWFEGKLADQPYVVTLEMCLRVSVPKVSNRICVLGKSILFLLGHHLNRIRVQPSTHNAALMGTCGYRIGLVLRRIFWRLEKIFRALWRHSHVRSNFFLPSVFFINWVAQAIISVNFVSLRSTNLLLINFILVLSMHGDLQRLFLGLNISVFSSGALNREFNESVLSLVPHNYRNLFAFFYFLCYAYSLDWSLVFISRFIFSLQKWVIKSSFRQFRDRDRLLIAFIAFFCFFLYQPD